MKFKCSLFNAKILKSNDSLDIIGDKSGHTNQRKKGSTGYFHGNNLFPLGSKDGMRRCSINSGS